MSWWLVNDVAVRAAAELPGELPPVRWLGIDETRTRRPRWRHDPDTGRWRPEDPWMTSLTNLDPAFGRVILGLDAGPILKDRVHLAPGTLAAVARRDRGHRDRPVRGLRRCRAKALPHAVVVVDHHDLDRLGNKMRLY